VKERECGKKAHHNLRFWDKFAPQLPKFGAMRQISELPLEAVIHSAWAPSEPRQKVVR